MTDSRIPLRFFGSAEVFRAPRGYNLTEALRWIGRCAHPSVYRIDALGGNGYCVHNGRRGTARRSYVVEVVS